MNKIGKAIRGIGIGLAAVMISGGIYQAKNNNFEEIMEAVRVEKEGLFKTAHKVYDIAKTLGKETEESYFTKGNFNILIEGIDHYGFPKSNRYENPTSFLEGKAVMERITIDHNGETVFQGEEIYGEDGENFGISAYKNGPWVEEFNQEYIRDL